MSKVAYRVWTKDEILASFEKYDRRSFVRVVKVIYDRQTADEREVKDTKHSNGMGFNGTDANFMMDIYEKACRYGGFTEGQFAAAKKCMKKYAGQLALVKNEAERAKWEAFREAEAAAERKAEEANPRLMAAVEALKTAPMDALTINESGIPDVLECMVCCGMTTGDPFCSTECADEYRIDNYEGPDAEDVALSRAYASAF